MKMQSMGKKNDTCNCMVQSVTMRESIMINLKEWVDGN